MYRWIVCFTVLFAASTAHAEDTARFSWTVEDRLNKHDEEIKDLKARLTELERKLVMQQVSTPAKASTAAVNSPAGYGGVPRKAGTAATAMAEGQVATYEDGTLEMKCIRLPNGQWQCPSVITSSYSVPSYSYGSYTVSDGGYFAGPVTFNGNPVRTFSGGGRTFYGVSEDCSDGHCGNGGTYMFPRVRRFLSGN